MKLHWQGQPKQAAKLYSQILEIDSHHLDAVHLCGVCAHQLGNYNEAARLIRLEIIISFKEFNYYANLASS